MNIKQIEKKLSLFEDEKWVKEFGFDGRRVMTEVLQMDKEEMANWIKEAINLFNLILDEESQ